MKGEYHKRFLKELAKIPAKQRKDIEQFVFNEIPNANNIFERVLHRKDNGAGSIL